MLFKEIYKLYPLLVSVTVSATCDVSTYDVVCVCLAVVFYYMV